jgi:hypothetical protein
VVYCITNYNINLIFVGIQLFLEYKKKNMITEKEIEQNFLDTFKSSNKLEMENELEKFDKRTSDELLRGVK